MGSLTLFSNMLERLSPDEKKVAILLATEGLDNEQIAQRLYWSKSKVINTLYSVFPKFDVSSRLQLALKVKDLLNQTAY